jgi:hypothetical protein
MGIHFMSVNNTCQWVFIEVLTFVISIQRLKYPWLDQLNTTPLFLRGKLVITTSIQCLTHLKWFLEEERAIGGEASCPKDKLISPCLPWTSLNSKVCLMGWPFDSQRSDSSDYIFSFLSSYSSEVILLSSLLLLCFFWTKILLKANINKKNC